MSRVCRQLPTTSAARRLGFGQQAGFSLIEVMVALLVLSVGLLGLAAMQATALSRSTSSDQRAQAVNAASEIIDMVRANRSEAIRYAGAFAEGDCVDGVVPPYGVADGSSLAIPERAAWINSVRCALPGASGNIALEAGNVIVSIAWADARWEEDEDDQATQITIESEL